MKQLKRLHALLTINGLIHETLTAANLIAFCSLSDSGNLSYGRRVFNRVEYPNKFMYNTLIRGYSNGGHATEALVLGCEMVERGLLPNNFTLPFVLKACTIRSAFRETTLIHALIVKIGFGSHVFVMNALLHAYAVCGQVEFACEVFDEIPERNIVSWNSMIDGYCGLGDCGKVFGLFKMVRDSGLQPDRFTLVSLLSICSQKGNLELGRLVHHYMVVSGVNVDLIVGNALVDMYGKCGELCMAQICFYDMPVRNVVSWTSLVCAHAKHGLVDLARSLFDRMPERNIVSWNAMISCYVQHGQYGEALALYMQMQNSRVRPDEATLVSVLSACSQSGNLVVGKKTHDYISENIGDVSVALHNSIVDMYAKCGLVDVALSQFKTMEGRNVVSWNVIIVALAMHGRGLDAVELFRAMVDEGVSPDGVTFVGLLSACSHNGLLEFGLHYFEVMQQVYQVPHEIEHYACMVDLLGRGGQLGEAVELIRNMPMKPDVVIWGAMLGACRIHHNILIGKQVMKQILELEPHSGGLYVLLSNLFFEAEMWEDMKQLRKFMKERGVRKGKATSLIEIDGDVYEFMVEDMSHENYNHLFALLDELRDHLASLGCLSDPSGAFCDEEE